MKRTKVSADRAVRILAAMITSDQFLAHTAGVWESNLIPELHFRVIAQWCIEHFNEYGEAPGEHIVDAFDHWAEDNTNEGAVDNASALLDSIDLHPDPINVPYMLECLKDFLTKKRLKKLQRDIEQEILHDNLQAAEETIINYRRIEVGGKQGIDPLKDDIWELVFAAKNESLLNFMPKSPFGRFFNRAMCRDSLIAIQAPEKTGKTWWGIEFAIRGLMQRRKVAMFQVGDLSKIQIMRRLATRWTGLPIHDDIEEALVPESIEVDAAMECGYEVISRKKKINHRLTEATAREGVARFKTACGMGSDNSYMKLSIHASDTCTVRNIDTILDQWEQEDGFIADIIVIDYADILAPEDTREIGRDAINSTWKALRRLSQERHALVIVPTQAKATAYGTEVDSLQSMKDFSEDKRKLAHVTGMIGLNQTPGEKEMGGMRLNWIVLRQASFSPFKPLYVGNCFSLGKAMCVASL